MKKTVLIPSDSTMESLNLFKYLMQTSTVDVHVIFLHCMTPSDSILDLLFTGSRDLAGSLVTRDFRDAISIIKNRYGSYRSTEVVEIFRGSTNVAFTNFLDGNKVDEIIIPKEYRFVKPHSNSLDPMSFIKETTRSVVEVSWTGSKTVPEKNQLAELFNIAS